MDLTRILSLLRVHFSLCSGDKPVFDVTSSSRVSGGHFDNVVPFADKVIKSHLIWPRPKAQTSDG